MKYNHFTDSTENYQKSYILNKWLPKFVSTVTQGCSLAFDIEENLKRSGFHSQQIITCANFEKTRCVMNKYIVNEESIQELMNSVDTIDVVKNRSQKYMEQNKKIEKLFSQSFGIKNFNDWIDEKSASDRTYV